MQSFNITQNTAQWLTTAFMLVNGIMIPVTAFLIRKFTTRVLFLTAMGLLGLGTLICAAAPNFSFLLAGRMVQATGAGIMMPLMQTVLFVIFPNLHAKNDGIFRIGVWFDADARWNCHGDFITGYRKNL